MRSLPLLRITGLDLSSALFFPVSCTTGVFVGTVALSEMDARDVSGGEKPHALFHILIRRPAESDTVSAIPLDELDRLEKSGDSYTFLMPTEEGEFGEGEWIRYKYRVVELEEGKQNIEVKYSDDDNSATSRYIAEAARVRPVYSKIFVPGYMFQSLPYAVGFAFILWLIGKYLARVYARQNEGALTSQSSRRENKRK